MSLDFAAVDVETANFHRGSICSFGVVVVRNGQITEKHHLLTCPPGEFNFFDAMNIDIHGITAADVANEPSFGTRLAQVLEIIGDLPIVAHNASFDVGAIREGCDEANIEWPTLTYGCSLVMARRAGLGLLSYRLPMVCDALGVNRGTHHRAEDDAEAAASIVLALAAKANTESLETLATSLMVRLGTLTNAGWAGCSRNAGSYLGNTARPVDANPNADPEHALFGRFIVFTGGLSLKREEAFELVARLGATAQNNLTKKTNFLVIGDGFTGHSAADFTTSKAMKAVKVNAAGGNVEILTEGDLLELLGETMTAGVRATVAARKVASTERKAARENATVMSYTILLPPFYLMTDARAAELKEEFELTGVVGDWRTPPKAYPDWKLPPEYYEDCIQKGSLLSDPRVFKAHTS